ncbi:hypothetical protein [Saccharopolyspora halophila]|uniref:hypothetical protein n=1 Tax=Saccharopolyspora halophila TaxID=405551 RepID=UPI0031D8658B
MSTGSRNEAGASIALVAIFTPLSVLFATRGWWVGFAFAFVAMLAAISWMGAQWARSR